MYYKFTLDEKFLISFINFFTKQISIDDEKFEEKIKIKHGQFRNGWNINLGFIRTQKVSHCCLSYI